MALSTVARAFLFNSDGNLVLVRHDTTMPWVLPGGHVEPSEGMHDALLREISEELGLKARFFEIDNEEILYHKGRKLSHLPLPLSIYELSYTDKSGKDKSRIEYVFLMETDDKKIEAQQSEIAKYKWFEVDEVLAMKPNVDTWDFIIEMLEKIVGDDDDTL
jgi:8-oxo-dGTP pyrophosphatase MutT (NUDIX family)